MKNFIKRLDAPTTDNRYYIHTSKGGLNNCILIGAKSVIPNCVGYGFGRVYELLGEYPKLSKNKAEGWFLHNDGYERGTTPKLGAVMCYSKGLAGNSKDGLGHVCIVEDIKEDGTVITSNSGYKSSRFYIKEIKPPYNMYGYTFQGFIYPPYEWYKKEEIKNPTKQDLPKLTINEIAKLVIKGKFGNGETRKKLLEKFGYNFSEVQTEVNKILGYNQPKKETYEEIKQPINSEYKVGDKVGFDYLYTDSYASTKKPLKSLIHYGTITKIYNGRKAPYLINNGSGFLSKDLIIRKY